jgi:hypothetical protein
MVRLGLGLKSKVQRLIYEAGLKAGMFVLPKNYFVPIADSADLRHRHEWMRRSTLAGLAVDLDQQVRCLQDICRPYQHEYEGNAHFREATAGSFGPGYGYIEAQALHAVIRWLKPHTGDCHLIAIPAALEGWHRSSHLATGHGAGPSCNTFQNCNQSLVRGLETGFLVRAVAASVSLAHLEPTSGRRSIPSRIA